MACGALLLWVVNRKYVFISLIRRKRIIRGECLFCLPFTTSRLEMKMRMSLAHAHTHTHPQPIAQCLTLKTACGIAHKRKNAPNKQTTNPVGPYTRTNRTNTHTQKRTGRNKIKMIMRCRRYQKTVREWEYACRLFFFAEGELRGGRDVLALTTHTWPVRDPVHMHWINQFRISNDPGQVINFGQSPVLAPLPLVWNFVLKKYGGLYRTFIDYTRARAHTHTRFTLCVNRYSRKSSRMV